MGRDVAVDLFVGEEDNQRMRQCLLLLAIPLLQGQTFEVASVKPASADERGIQCSGGPGTTSPGIWRCSNVPLGFVITRAYGFEAYQFPPHDPCCQTRFDFEAKLLPGATKSQFQNMLQKLLAERFKLALHLEAKEMPVFELSVAGKGLKLKPSAPDAAAPPEDPWMPAAYTIGKDGYPKFPAGHGGLAGAGGRYHWTAFHVPMQEIASTVSFHAGRPVIDTTGLTGTYDIDLKWTIDVAWLLENAGMRDRIPELAKDAPTGPTLVHAVRDQLGLDLTSKKGRGEIVVIDHVEKVPTGN
jgi:uncharacterized protein (TIGR03435 family)